MMAQNSLNLSSPSKKQNWGTLDLKPESGEMIKPAEAIDIIGIDGLTLYDKQTWNKLLSNAHGPQLREEDKDFKIALSELTGSHNGNDRVDESIERLMKTIARLRMPNGSITRFQLLGGNNMGDPNRPRGELTYRFDKDLVKVLRDSTMFGKLEIYVMAAFSSKYALALYEHMSRKVNLRNKWSHIYSIEEFREILEVRENQYKAFGSLKQRCIEPALKEVNSWAAFDLEIKYKKTGQKVTKVEISWFYKDREDRAKIKEELTKSRIGRKERMEGIKETVSIVENDNLLDKS